MAFPVHWDQNIEEENSRNALKDLDTHFLQDKKFLVDENNMTIADISAACEIMQTKMFDFDYSEYKNVTRWMDLMMSFKEMQEVHNPFMKLVTLSKSRNQ